MLRECLSDVATRSRSESRNAGSAGISDSRVWVTFREEFGTQANLMDYSFQHALSEYQLNTSLQNMGVVDNLVIVEACITVVSH